MGLPDVVLTTRFARCCRRLLESLRTRVVEFVGDALSYVNTSLEPEFEYQRDPKGANSLLKVAKVMVFSRGPNYCSQVDGKRGITILNSRKSLYANTVLKRKADEALMERLRRGEPLPLYREGEEGGKNFSRSQVAIRATTFYRMQMMSRAGFDVALRLKSDESEEAERVLSGYSKLLDGLLGMGCHPYQQVAIKSCQTMMSVGKRFGFMINRRLPRMLAVMDLSDSAFASEPFGIPIAQDLVNDAKGNARLAELLFGVMIHIQANFHHIVKRREHMYNFVRKFTAISAVVAERLVPDKLVVLNSLLERTFDQFRQRFVVEPSDDEHREMILFLLKKLQADRGIAGKREEEVRS